MVIKIIVVELAILLAILCGKVLKIFLKKFEKIKKLRIYK